MRTRIFILLYLVGAMAAGAQPLIFGTYPFGDPKSIYFAFLPLAERIASESGREVSLVVTRDYGELSERLKEGSVDVAWINSSNYIKVKAAQPDIIYLATYMELDASGTRIQPYYQAKILCLKEKPYTTLPDLKGQRLGLVDMDSTSGYAYPMQLFRENGIDPQAFFSKIFLLGKHNKVIEALLAGAIDAGGVSDGTYYNALKNHGDKFRILAESSPIPLDALVARPGLQPSVVNQVRGILLALPADDPVFANIMERLGWPAAGFREMDDSFYDSIRKALNFKGQ